MKDYVAFGCFCLSMVILAILISLGGCRRDPCPGPGPCPVPQEIALPVEIQIDLPAVECPCPNPCPNPWPRGLLHEELAPLPPRVAVG